MQEPAKQPYVGRFAPSPSGPLHLGSMFSALASWLDARAAGGRWLLRIEDIDTPRVVSGAADEIMRQLEAFGLEWDGEPVYQSTRHELYASALRQLHDQGLLFPCICTRRDLDKFTDRVYPGTCRSRVRTLETPANLEFSWRLRVNSEAIVVEDRLLPPLQQRLADAVGDFVLQRRDGIYAYQLAVVVDDAAQGITDIVRGADIHDSTPRQYYLQSLLALPHPSYAHTPLLVANDGCKLSKQNLAAPVETQHIEEGIIQLLNMLGHPVPVDLSGSSRADLLHWAVEHWDISNVPRRPIPVSANVHA